MQEKEVTVFCNYLVKKAPTALVTELYSKAIATLPNTISEKEKKIIAFALKNSWSIALLDSGAALLAPQSELRRRLFILFAILESTPDHCERFMTTNRGPFYLFTILFVGTRSILRALAGIILYKLV